MSSTPVKSNADFVLTDTRTAVYVGIDTVGGLRQTAAATESIALLSHASTAARVAGSAIPIGLLITGPLCAATAIAWTIPDAQKALKQAEQEQEAATSPQAQQEAATAVQVAQLGLANHGLYLSMGLAQTATGVTTLCSPAAAHAMHYSPVLTGNAATTAATVTGVALGAIYAARGAVMLARAIKSHKLVTDFHAQFASHFEHKDRPTAIRNAIAFMVKAETEGSAYMDRRVDASCLGTDTGTNRASNIKDSSIEEQTAYLAKVDKGIYTEKLKHRIAQIIATAMIIGGILAILLSVVFTGGLSLALIGLFSALFFMSMEYIFITYDSSAAFEWLRDRLYSLPSWAVTQQNT